MLSFPSTVTSEQWSYWQAHPAELQDAALPLPACERLIGLFEAVERDIPWCQAHPEIENRFLDWAETCQNREDLPAEERARISQIVERAIGVTKTCQELVAGLPATHDTLIQKLEDPRFGPHVRLSRLNKWQFEKVLFLLPATLTTLNFSGCSFHILPDLSRFTELKRLDLVDCTSLVDLSSVSMRKPPLEMLNLTGCSSLVTIPKFTTVKLLDITGCIKLREQCLEDLAKRHYYMLPREYYTLPVWTTPIEFYWRGNPACLEALMQKHGAHYGFRFDPAELNKHLPELS